MIGQRLEGTLMSQSVQAGRHVQPRDFKQHNILCCANYVQKPKFVFVEAGVLRWVFQFRCYKVGVSKSEIPENQKLQKYQV